MKYSHVNFFKEVTLCISRMKRRATRRNALFWAIYILWIIIMVWVFFKTRTGNRVLIPYAPPQKITMTID